jgi:general secretion pathway protein A
MVPSPAVRTLLTGAPLYLTHFGLAEAPFSTTPDPRFLYLSDRHRDGFAHLLYGVGERGGFVQLTGEVGTGKTTLCRRLLDHLPDHVDVALILNPTLSRLELLATICDELRVAYPTGTDSIKTLVEALYARLLEAHGQGRRVVVIVDEAQHLSGQVLEQLRLLTNLETGKAKLLQIILIGQPELIDRLGQTALRQVAQRVAARYHLEPLDEHDTRAYVRHRLAMVGQSDPIFHDRALRILHRASRGLPRMINVLCDRALLGAYAERSPQVTARIARRAIREVFGADSRRGAQRRRTIERAAAVALVVALASALAAIPFTLWKRPAHVVAAPTPPAVVTPMPTAAPPAGGADGLTPLKALLDVPAGASDIHAAYSNVAARWGKSYDGRGNAAPCEVVQRLALACLARRGTWTLLAQFDLPAVLEIVAPSGITHALALTGIDGNRAAVVLGTRRAIVTVDEIQQEWHGSFVVLWKPPHAGIEPIGPGAEGSDVVWLRQRLAEVNGTPRETPTSPRVYDAQLAEGIMAFQRHHRLLPDGIAGAETLARLTSLLNPGAPSLRASGVRS